MEQNARRRDAARKPIFIPLTGYIKFVRPRRKHPIPHKIHAYANDQNDELSRFSHVHPSVCTYANYSLSFWDIDPKFYTRPFLPKKLLICRKRHYRTTIAYSCHTNWTIKIKLLYGIFCVCEGYNSFDATEVNVFSYFIDKMPYKTYKDLKSVV